MTITFVGVGTTATGNNASVTPVAHASTQPGDVVLLFASIRNSGTGTVDDNPFWTWWISGSANAKVYGKVWQVGDVIPAVTFTGGAANADTIAQVLTFRGVEAYRTDLAVEQLNASAQNANYPALDVPGDGHAVILFVWKQDDNTGAGTPAGFTALANTSVTAGDDASQIIRYQIQTTEADLSSGTLTVTGGAAAISRAIVVALRPAAALAVTTQDVYPPRNVIAMSGLTLGDDLVVYREVSGVRTVVRGGDAGSVADTGFVTIDAELPFGVPLRYVAVVNGTVEYTSATTTYALPGGKVVLSDAITGLAAEVAIMAAEPLVYGRDSVRMRVGGRNVVVTGPEGQAEGTYDIFTETTTALENLRDLLANATEAVVQVRQPGGYDGVDAYLAIDGASVARWSQDGSDERRVTTAQFAEVDGWADTLTARGFTYADLEAYYTGLVYTDLAGDYATYLDLAQGDFS